MSAVPVALGMMAARSQSPPASPPSSTDAPSAGAAIGPPGSGAPPGQFFFPPGEPDNHKLLSPLKRAPPGAVVASSAPPTGPRDFEGAWGEVREFNALSEAPGDEIWRLPPFTAHAQRMFWHRVEMENAGTPVPDAGIRCEPMGLARGVNAEFGFRVLQTPTHLLWIMNEDHLVRRFRIGGTHPAAITPSYMGDSIAHWEGDTLVIDSIGFNDRTWLDFDGTPHSKRLHVTERLRKIDNGARIEDAMTINDPVMYTRPWTVRMVYAWAPITQASPEIICEENDVELLDYKGQDVD